MISVFSTNEVHNIFSFYRLTLGSKRRMLKILSFQLASPTRLRILLKEKIIVHLVF